MKKLLSITLTVIMMLSLIACSKKTDYSTSSNNSSSDTVENNTSTNENSDNINTEQSSNENSDNINAEQSANENLDNISTEQSDTTSNNDSIAPEFKSTMDSYEAFIDEYIEFIQKYNESSDASSMLNDYTQYTAKYADTMTKIDSISKDNLNNAELAYYTDVMLRINEKLVKIAQ